MSIHSTSLKAASNQGTEADKTARRRLHRRTRAPRTETNSADYTRTFHCDSFDRVTHISHPDSNFEGFKDGRVNVATMFAARSHVARRVTRVAGRQEKGRR